MKEGRNNSENESVSLKLPRKRYLRKMSSVDHKVNRMLTKYQKNIVKTTMLGT